MDILNKRLRKRIRELCEIDNLAKEDKLDRAREILQDNDLKQLLCNRVHGLSFRDIDKVMRGILKESEFETEDQILEREVPEKVHPEMFLKFTPKTPKNAHNPSDTYSLEEMRNLVAASNKPVEIESNNKTTYSYDTYSLEEMADLVAGNYDPYRYKRKKRRKKG